MGSPLAHTASQLSKGLQALPHQERKSCKLISCLSAICITASYCFTPMSQKSKYLVLIDIFKVFTHFQIFAVKFLLLSVPVLCLYFLLELVFFLLISTLKTLLSCLPHFSDIFLNTHHFLFQFFPSLSYFKFIS